jgi:hypothetical protein
MRTTEVAVHPLVTLDGDNSKIRLNQGALKEGKNESDVYLADSR